MRRRRGGRKRAQLNQTGFTPAVVGEKKRKKKPRAFDPHGSESSGSLTAVGWLGSSRLMLLIQQLGYPAAALEVLHGG